MWEQPPNFHLSAILFQTNIREFRDQTNFWLQLRQYQPPTEVHPAPVKAKSCVLNWLSEGSLYASIIWLFTWFSFAFPRASRGLLFQQSCFSVGAHRHCWSHVSLRGQSPGSLFCWPDASPISRSCFVAALTEDLQFCNLNVFQYKTHSSRIGAAFWSAAMGKSDAQIRTFGRWQSNAFFTTGTNFHNWDYLGSLNLTQCHMLMLAVHYYFSSIVQIFWAGANCISIICVYRTSSSVLDIFVLLRWRVAWLGAFVQGPTVSWKVQLILQCNA